MRIMIHTQVHRADEHLWEVGFAITEAGVPPFLWYISVYDNTVEGRRISEEVINTIVGPTATDILYRIMRNLEPRRDRLTELIAEAPQGAAPPIDDAPRMMRVGAYTLPAPPRTANINRDLERYHAEWQRVRAR